MTKDVQETITNLYEVFSKYPLNESMEASPLYSKEKVAKWNQSISTKPLREMSGDELSFIAFKVGYTWGNEKDYKHFLPRFLELIAEYKEGLIESFIVFKKLSYFLWQNWDEKEQHVVQMFLNSFWLQLLNDERLPYQFEDHFISMFQLYDQPELLLAEWYNAESLASIKQFCDFIIDREHGINRRSEISSLDKKDGKYKANSALIINWSQTKMKSKIEQLVYSDKIKSDLLDKILKTIEILEN